MERDDSVQAWRMRLSDQGEKVRIDDCGVNPFASDGDHQGDQVKYNSQSYKPYTPPIRARERPDRREECEHSS
jgi:hypothetical protein